MTKIFDYLQQRQLKTEEAVKRYHASKCIGHSKIVNFETYGPTALRDDFTLNVTDAMEFGSLVDTLLTRNSEFTNIYYIPSTDIKTTPSEIPFIEYFITNKINPYSLTDDELLEVMNCCKIYTIFTKNVDARIEKAKKLFPLISERLKNINKKIITKEQFQEALNCIETLKTSDITKHIFSDPKKVLFQVELESSSQQLHCLFDIIYIDFEHKTIHPIDLKCTSYPERDFINNSFYKFKYYRQAELYTQLLKAHLDYNITEDWSIAPFKFLVICKNTLSPMIYEFPVVYEDNQLVISENKKVKQLNDVVDDMRWHLLNKQFMYDKDTYIELFKKRKKHYTFITKRILDVSKEDASIKLHGVEGAQLNYEQPRISTRFHLDEAVLQQLNNLSPLDGDIRFDGTTATTTWATSSADSDTTSIHLETI